jgi:two-component system OmpR family sensor kinase
VSLRLRLLLVLGAVAIAAFAIADFAIYASLRSSLFGRVDQQLQDQSATFAHHHACPGQFAHLFPGGPGGPPPPGGNEAPLVSFPYQALVTPGSPGQSLTCAAQVGNHTYSPKLPTAFTGFSAGPDGTRVTYLTASSTAAGGPTFEVRVAKLADGQLLIVGTPIDDTLSTLHHLLLIELGVTAGAVVVALVAGWWLVRLGLRPLVAVERTAENIAAGDLQHRVPNDEARTEVGRLARTFNVMLERIESAFAARLASEERLRASDRRLRQFVADASHELRTPIAAVSAYAQLFEQGAGRNEEDLGRVMTGIRAETTRMERLVADLLTLARLDEGQPIEREAIELVTLCAEAAQTARTVAPAWPITLVATEPVEVDGDSHRLRQVVDNLLANVRSHTPERTPTEISIRREDSEAVVVVADAGPGMPPEQAAQVFERFYRADPSRSRGRGGAGLGLSIVDAIVTAHCGTVTASSPSGGGMTITIRLPIDAGSDRGDDEGAAQAAPIEPEPAPVQS